jgi:hypothetical protein
MFEKVEKSQVKSQFNFPHISSNMADKSSYEIEYNNLDQLTEVLESWQRLGNGAGSLGCHPEEGGGCSTHCVQHVSKFKSGLKCSRQNFGVRTGV